ncbi:MAG: hypothetical protein NVSMB30_05220 [Hymenobacter sp.]
MLLLALLAGFVLPWVVFVNVAEDVWESGGFFGDNAILEFLHRHATPGLDKLALALTAIGDPLPMSVLALLITLGLAVWGRRSQAWFFGLSVTGALLLNLVVKHFFARLRPDLWVSIKPALSYSFPSGHSMGAAAVAAALGFLVWRHRGQGVVWLLGPLFALGVGWSRMYLGVHYPSDVLAGWGARWGGWGRCTCCFRRRSTSCGACGAGPYTASCPPWCRPRSRSPGPHPGRSGLPSAQFSSEPAHEPQGWDGRAASYHTHRVPSSTNSLPWRSPTFSKMRRELALLTSAYAQIRGRCRASKPRRSQA